MTKNDCLDFLSLNLAKTSTWRGRQSKRWPEDTRNARAARLLFDLAAQATDIDDATWGRISPHCDPIDRHWCEAVSAASRDVGFRAAPDTFDAYVQTVLAALMVTA